MSPTFVLIFSVFVGSSLIFVAPIILVAAGSDFNKEVDMNWGGNRAQVLDGGKLASLTLDQTSGSGFQSKTEFLFGRVDMEIKLVPGNSAGTVTAFYLSSEWPNQDEIDFEFLGNLSGQPYIVHTNIYTEGKGNREQQFYLWFDPRKDFHTYSIVWNPRRIIFLVDSIPLRVFSSDELLGIPFPKTKPMRVYSSLWDAEQWATMGGRVKTDWSNAPFTAYFRNLKIEACTWSNGGYSACETKSASATARTTTWLSQELDATGRRRLRWVQKYFMVYNYCTDLKRFPQGHPRECKRSRF